MSVFFMLLLHARDTELGDAAVVVAIILMDIKAALPERLLWGADTRP